MEQNILDSNLTAFLKTKVINEIIMDLRNIELPPEWTPRDVLGFVINKIENKRNKV